MILELSLATIGGGTVIVGLWNFLFKGVINKRRNRRSFSEEIVASQNSTGREELTYTPTRRRPNEDENCGRDSKDHLLNTGG